MKKVVIDAMGGDNGVGPIVDGMLQALENEKFHAIIVGDSKEITPLLDRGMAKYRPSIEVVHAPSFIAMEESASNAIKRTDSSIYMAMELLREGSADALVSAGHSGATMSLATLRIGRIKGVLRPAICTLMPTVLGHPSLILDAGANTDCKPEYLEQFALMGYQYAHDVLKMPNPRVGLLANGEEDNKGNDLTKEAFTLLKKYDFFKGNVEGGDIFNGESDVIVCDGFVGNITLKTSEAVARTIGAILKKEVLAMGASVKLGAYLIKPALKRLKLQTDYAEYGGAPLLGVQKMVIISHGKSNARAIECAIYQALNSLDAELTEHIKKAFEKEGKDIATSEETGQS